MYKKGDIYDKGEYLQVVWRCFNRSTRGNLNPSLSDPMSGFGKGHSCQSFVGNFLEICKAKLDSKYFVGTILVDLSKASIASHMAFLSASFQCMGYIMTLYSLY